VKIFLTVMIVHGIECEMHTPIPAMPGIIPNVDPCSWLLEDMLVGCIHLIIRGVDNKSDVNPYH
jgi:hypothetical protein